MSSFPSNIFLIILFGPQSFSTHRLWIKQRSSLVNPTIVTKLQFIHPKTEHVYIGRQLTTSFNENDTWINKNCQQNSSNEDRKLKYDRGVAFLHTVYVCGTSRGRQASLMRWHPFGYVVTAVDKWLQMTNECECSEIVYLALELSDLIRKLFSLLDILPLWLTFRVEDLQQVKMFLFQLLFLLQ